MQILSALFTFILTILNLFGPLFRLVGLIISSIPGSKTVLKFIPFVDGKDDSDDDIPAGEEWKRGRTLRHEMRRNYFNTPSVIERQFLERTPLIGRSIYFNNKILTTKCYSQPRNIKISVCFK